MDKMINTAMLSHCRQYRYELWRNKDIFKPHVLFIMLNPSTADADTDDQTIIKCKGFAKTWGFESFCVVNLFALRATHPAALLKHPKPNDIYSDMAIQRNIGSADMIVCAWGYNGKHQGRDSQGINMLNGRKAYCLGLNMNGTPKHPLYLPYDTPLQEYRYNE